METNLRLDWCSYEAAKYAVMNWHYSKRMPQFKRVMIGVWENNIFIGVIIFSNGASSSLPKPYGLTMQECSELTRVALNYHTTPVSKMVSIAVKMLKKQSPNLRLLVSFADPYQGHNGGIYQALNWIYSGITNDTPIYFRKDGKELHSRNIGAYNGHDRYGVTKYKASECMKEKRPGKYRYLYPLDKEMRKQIEPLAKPYPKNAAIAQGNASRNQREDGVRNDLAAQKILETA